MYNEKNAIAPLEPLETLLSTPIPQRRPIGVYIHVDDMGRITAINSSAFLADTNGWTRIDEGFGDKYHHAQDNYLPKPLRDERGICHYCWDGQQVVERTKEVMDADYAAPVPISLTEAKRTSLEKLSAACQQAIFAGVDVEISEGVVKHYDLEIEDQVNLLSLSTLIANGETAIPYHASDELCEFYTVEQMTKIITAATELKTYHTTYYNSLKNWVQSMQTVDEVYAVQYGDQIPEAYRSDILKQMMAGDSNEISA